MTAMNAVLLGFSLLQGATVTTDGVTVEIAVNGLSNTQGVLYAGLCKEPGWDTFDCNSVALKPAAGTMTHQWHNVAPGEYGVTLLHDANENGKMDFNFFGAPEEQWGTSNNPAPRMGPSLWQDAKFQVADKPVNLDIKMQPEDQ